MNEHSEWLNPTSMPPLLKKKPAERTLDAVVVLEVMWDWNAMTTDAGYAEEAPRWFSINPDNFSGRRLHYLMDGRSFLVTNACRELVTSAKGRGKADPAWLAENLEAMSKWGYKLLLVCGGVAWETYQKCGYRPPGCRILKMKHPAARDWTTEHLKRYQRWINAPAE